MRYVLCSTAVLLAMAAPTLAKDESEAVTKALAAYQAGDFKKTVELAAAVPATDPSRTKTQYLAGEAQLALRDFGAAETAFREVIAAKAKAQPALIGLGRALAGQGKGEEAEKSLKSALEVDKKDANALRALGEYYTGAGKAELGVPLCAEAYKKDAKDPQSARAYVEALVAAASHDLARGVAEKLLKDKPEHPMGHFLRAYVFDKTDKDVEAIAAYEAAIAKDELFLDAHKNLAILCHAKNPIYKDKERTRKMLKHYRLYFANGGTDEKLKQLYSQAKGFLEQMDPSLRDA